MPDALHWMGVTRIHKLVSMSDMKYDAITKSVRTLLLLSGKPCRALFPQPLSPSRPSLCCT